MQTAIYALYGDDKYFAEGARSAQSVGIHSASTKRVAYVRKDDAGRLDRSAFDEIRVADFAPRASLRMDFQLKMHAVSDGLSGLTVFFDTDTFVCASIDPAWRLLARFDVLACHAPFRRRLRYENYVVPDFVSEVPEAFCELNTGVVFLADRPSTRAMVEDWRQLYETAPGSGDQYLFMEAVYRSECRLYVLPPEYNYRFFIPQFAGDQIRIVHGRWATIEKAVEILNQTTLPRVSCFENGKINMSAAKISTPRPKSAG